VLLNKEADRMIWHKDPTLEFIDLSFINLNSKSNWVLSAIE